MVFNLHQYKPRNLIPGNSLEVLSGSGMEIVKDAYIGAGVYFMGLKFTEPGKSEVKVAVSDPRIGESGEKNFTFTVSERPADKPVKVIANPPAVISQKVGEIINLTNAENVRFENLNYGPEPALSHLLSGGLDIDLGNVLAVAMVGKGGGGFDYVGNERSYDQVGRGDLSEFWTLGSLEPTMIGKLGGVPHAATPGVITVQPVYASEKSAIPSARLR